MVIGNLTELLLPLLRSRRVHKKEKDLCEGKAFIRVEEEFMLTKVCICTM